MAGYSKTILRKAVIRRWTSLKCIFLDTLFVIDRATKWTGEEGKEMGGEGNGRGRVGFCDGHCGNLPHRGRNRRILKKEC